MRFRIFLCALLACITVICIAACGGGHRVQKQQFHPVLAPQLQQSVQEKCRTVPPGTPPVRASSIRAGLMCPPKSGLRMAIPMSSGPNSVQMFDSVDNNIPSSAQAAAGYVNGLYQSYRWFVGRYPHVVGISVDSDNHSYGGADCADFEPSPGRWQNDSSNAGPWAKWQRSQGNTRPCLYTSYSLMAPLEASLRAWLGTNWRSEVRLWDADYTFSYHIDWDPNSNTAFDGTQYTDTCNGQNLDCSAMQPGFYSQPAPVDPNYAPSFNIGYSAGIGGAYRVGYNADHHPKTIEKGAFNVGFRAGYSSAKVAGSATRHKVGYPRTYNTSFNWGYYEGWAAGRGGTFRVWFGTLYSTPSSRVAADDGYRIAYPKSFDQAWRNGFYANKRR